MRYLIATLLATGCASCSNGTHGGSERGLRVLESSQTDTAGSTGAGGQADAVSSAGPAEAAETATVD